MDAPKNALETKSNKNLGDIVSSLMKKFSPDNLTSAALNLSESADALVEAEVQKRMKIFASESLQQLFELSREVHQVEQERFQAEKLIHKLTSKIEELETKQVEFSLYVKQQQDTGVVVYVLKEELEKDSISVYACPKCFHEQSIHFLKPTGKTTVISEKNGWFNEYSCPSCKNEFVFGFSSKYEGFTSSSASSSYF